MVCACRNVNHSLLSVAPCLNQLSHVLFGCTGATSEQCCPCLVLCVLSGQKGCDKAHLLLSEVLPGSHVLHTTESPVCSLSSALIPFIFLTHGTRARQNESRCLSIKAILCLDDFCSLRVLLLVSVCESVIKGALEGFRFAPPWSWRTHKRQAEKKSQSNQQRLKCPDC